MFEIFLFISEWSIPLLLIIILGFAASKKVAIYEVFLAGALEGLKTTFKLIPYILAIFVAVGIFRISGSLELFTQMIKNIIPFAFPGELLTLGLLKPLSGSASLGITAAILSKFGPDSFAGIMASIIQGSSETTFYVVSLYLGYIGIKDSRQILMVGLLNDLTVFLLAILIGNIYQSF